MNTGCVMGQGAARAAIIAAAVVCSRRFFSDWPFAVGDAVGDVVGASGGGDDFKCLL